MVDFPHGQATTRRRAAGVAVVVVLHAVLIGGLMRGLSRKEVEVVRAPIEVRVIEEITKLPPPPEVAPPPPPPKLKTPPPPTAPPVVPPPEVPVVAPPPATAITVAPAVPAPAPVATAPMAQAAPAPASATPANEPSVSVSCPGYKEMLLDGGFPREARRAQIDAGEVTVVFTIAANGDVKNPVIQKSTHRAFNRHSLQIVSQFKCIGQGRDVLDVPVTIGYTDR